MVALPSSPAFGTADLSNCEREQIHLAGSIQPHGALLVVRESDQVIVQASSNAAGRLGVARLQGARLRALGGNLWRRIGGRLPDGIQSIPAAMRCTIGALTDPWNALVHRTPDGELVVELERAGPPEAIAEALESAVQGIVSATALQTLCDESARIFRDLTGYDRVMVYRFDEAGHGEVLSETKKNRSRSLPRQPLSRVGHSADRPASLRAQPGAGSGRHRLRACRPVAPPVPDFGQGSRHVAVLPAQRIANSSAISQKHGRCGHAGRLADGRGASLGPRLLPSLFASSPAFRNALRVRASGRSDGHPNRSPGELCQGAGRARSASSRAANDRTGVARWGLAGRTVRPLPPAALAARGERRGPHVRK